MHVCNKYNIYLCIKIGMVTGMLAVYYRQSNCVTDHPSSGSVCGTRRNLEYFYILHFIWQAVGRSGAQHA